LEVDYTGLGRYEPDGTVTFVGMWGSTGAALPVPSGIRTSVGVPINVKGRLGGL
jgi:hypothetical protein